MMGSYNSTAPVVVAIVVIHMTKVCICIHNNNVPLNKMIPLPNNIEQHTPPITSILSQNAPGCIWSANGNPD